jgi:hypothetical protein
MFVESFGRENSGSVVQRSQKSRTVTAATRTLPNRSRAFSRARLASVLVANVPGPPRTRETLTLCPNAIPVNQLAAARGAHQLVAARKLPDLLVLLELVDQAKKLQIIPAHRERLSSNPASLDGGQQSRAARRMSAVSVAGRAPASAVAPRELWARGQPAASLDVLAWRALQIRHRHTAGLTLKTSSSSRPASPSYSTAARPQPGA